MVLSTDKKREPESISSSRYSICALADVGAPHYNELAGWLAGWLQLLRKQIVRLIMCPFPLLPVLVSFDNHNRAR